MIELKHLNVIYDQKIKAINNVSLQLNHHCIGIIGQNGSGKSTLLSSIVGLVDIDGEINVNGIVQSRNTLTTIRQQVGFVFQNPDSQLFMPTVKEDLLFGMINIGLSKDEQESRLNEITELFHLDHLLNRHPSSLSGGQKRMVAIASVLCMKPSILLLDEPSSFLDPKSRRIVMDMMKSLKQDMIFATHDLDMALDLCDEIILIDEGRIIKQGTTKDILLDKQLLEDHGLELPLRYQEVLYECQRDTK